MKEIQSTPDYSDILNEIKAAPLRASKSANISSALPTFGLPAKFIDYCKHVANRRNVPNEVTLMAALTVAGAAAGSFVESDIAGFKNKPGLMTLIVAPSAAGKSQPLRDIMKPLFAIDGELLSTYKSKLEAWRSENAKASNPAPRPEKTQILCAAATDAARIEFVCDNPRGGILYNDELRAFFKSLSGKFNEQAVEHILEISNFNPIKRDTKGEDVIKVCSESFLAVLGGVQTDLIHETIKPDFIANGLLHRFSIVMFEASGFPKIGDGIDMTQTAYWNNTVKSLRGLGNIVWKFSPNVEGREVFAREYEKLCASFSADPEDGTAYNNFKHAAFAKVMYAVHQLTLIAHLLKIVDATPDYPYTHPDIEADTIRWAFACAPYLIAQKMNAYNLIVGKPKPRTDEEIIRELAGMMARKGKKLNRSKLAEAVGIDRANISRYTKGIATDD